MSYVSSKDIFKAAVPLVGEGGYYKLLENEVYFLQSSYNDIRSQLSADYDREKRDEHYQFAVGHYGLGGEFANGVGSAVARYLCALEPVIRKPESSFITENSKAIRMAFDHVAATFYDRDSQKSQYYPEEAAQEKSGSALKRSLTDLHDWITATRQDISELPPEKRTRVGGTLDKMLLSIERCEEAYARIENFAQVTSLYAAQNNRSVERLQTREQIGFVSSILRRVPG